MPTLGSNTSACLDLLGNYDIKSFPNMIGRVARVINQVARTMMREARLSDQQQYITFLPIVPSSNEISIPSITDPNSICTVELLLDAINDERVDIQIVNRVELNAVGRPACARFGRPTRLRFNWNPVTEQLSGLGSDTIYVGYENLPVLSDNNLNSIPALPQDFHDCLAYRSAAIVREAVLEKPCPPVFLDTMKTMERQWKEWVDRAAEERPVLKGGFGTVDCELDPMGAY